MHWQYAFKFGMVMCLARALTDCEYYVNLKIKKHCNESAF